MPSASAKIDKTQSVEANDAGKQFVNMLEKRMRNLEKRKMKLDNYRSDVEKGKELNEDQKMAVSKYESVLSLLDFAKDMYKSALTVYQENSRQQKKQAKKEQLERQQYEIQRLQEAFIYCNLLSCFQNEDVRNDFLNGENGAIKLTNEQLSQLDSLYKLIGPGLPNEQADITSYFHALAENHIFLVEGRNKEIVGTTYKVLKEILQSIRESGYFSKPSEPVEDVVSSDDMPEEDTVEKPDEPQEYAVQAETFEAAQDQEKYEAPETHQEQSSSPLPESVVPEPVSIVQNGPLQEVLSTQGTINFLQESQIDLGAPHMDPAVVAVHQMAPPPAVNFGINSYSSPPVEESAQPMVNGNGTTDPRELSASPSAVNQVPVMSGGMPRSVAPQIVQHGAQHDFDPSHPIPTQTFTNQSFAVMQNMIMPQAYVPVTMHHAPLPPHMAPIAVVPAPPAVSSALPVQSLPEEIPLVINPEQEEVLPNGDGAPESDPNANESPVEKSENNANGHYRGGYRGRGRGRGNNGYYRGRSSYHNGHNNGRGGYQNHYYQDRDRNGYNNNYNRRGNNNNRGKFEGPRGNGNYRGRGNFNRSQGPQQQQQQQQAPQQQTQQ